MGNREWGRAGGAIGYDAPVDARIIALEERLAYQAKLLRELDEVVLGFTERVIALERRVRELEDTTVSADSLEPHDTPPPHY